MEIDKIKLNLGCGLQCPEGWMNIDSSMGARLAKLPTLKKILYAILPASWGVLPNIEWPSNVMWMNIVRRFNFEDDSVDIIYSSHTIEHLTYEEAAFVFGECYRVLKPGGRIRIIVPDLSVMINSYIENAKNKPELAAKHFFRDTYYFEIPIPNSFFGLMKFYFKRKNNHHFLYDKEGLSFQMEQAGFTDINSFGYGESKIENIIDIDIPERFENAICLEASKSKPH